MCRSRRSLQHVYVVANLVFVLGVMKLLHVALHASALLAIRTLHHVVRSALLAATKAHREATKALHAQKHRLKIKAHRVKRRVKIATDPYQGAFNQRPPNENGRHPKVVARYLPERSLFVLPSNPGQVSYSINNF